MKLCDVISNQALLNSICEEQADLLSFAVLACLDTIHKNVAKETLDPTPIWLACSNDWTNYPSKWFKMAQNALTPCLTSLDMTATGAMLLPSTLLYKDFDLKHKHKEQVMQSWVKKLYTLGHPTPTTLMEPIIASMNNPTTTMWKNYP